MAAEKEIQDLPMLSREQFGELLNGISDLVWSISVDGQKLLYINPVAARIYDRSAEELLSRPGLWFDAVHHDDQG